jgi:DNA-binding transcriptional MerR regulator
MHIFAGRCARSDGAGWIGEAATLALIGTMTIGELARRAHVNPRTLRYYERIGLLMPSARTDTGYRLYTERDAARLAFIRRAQALGFSLTEITDIIAIRQAGTAPCRHVRAVAQAKVGTIDARIAALQALREDLVQLAQRAEAIENTCVEGASICPAVEQAAPSPP